MNKHFILYVSGILFLIVLALALQIWGYADAAWYVGYIGTALYLFTVLLYISIFDSKKRWPGLPFSQRLAKILSFQR